MEATAGTAVLVATAAGEVGIDLDADHMVCDLVAVERLIQRLGRVNQAGGEGRAARVTVVVPPDMDAETRARLEAPLRALSPLDDGSLDAGSLDASPRALLALLALRQAHTDLIAAATTPAPLHPPLARATVDAWAMTALEHHAGRLRVPGCAAGWRRRQRRRCCGGAICPGATGLPPMRSWTPSSPPPRPTFWKGWRRRWSASAACSPPG